MKKILSILFLFPLFTFAQDDLLAGMDSVPKNQPVESAFKALKIVNLESTKLAAKGDIYLVIAHRFGSIKDGSEGFWGLDNAVTQIKLLYGVSKWLTISGARSEQAYDFSVKYRIQEQMKNGFPLTIVGFNSLGFNNLLKENIYPKMKFEDRMIYVSQLLISSKISKRLSLELAPTYFHENFVANDLQDNSQYAIGMGGRFKLTNRLSVNVDYATHLNRTATSTFVDPLSIGVDLETGGHVFQMHLSNSQGIHEVGFLGNTTGDWNTGEIFFGFNLLRVF
jgi:hypothetical protein